MELELFAVACAALVMIGISLIVWVKSPHTRRPDECDVMEKKFADAQKAREARERRRPPTVTDITAANANEPNTDRTNGDAA